MSEGEIVSFVRRQVQLLLLPDDEDKIVRAIRAKYPEVKILAGVPWEAADKPPVRESVGDCGTTATIWNPVLHPVLSVDVRSDGSIFGPSSGPVVQWVRSLEKSPGILDSGRWAAGFNKEKDSEMASFVGSLWRILNHCTTNRMVRTVGADADAPGVVPERGFRVGASAAERGLKGTLRMRSGQMYLRSEAI